MKSPSKGRLFLFHWDEPAARTRAAQLAAAGWQVELEAEEGSRGCKNAKTFSPDVVVLDIAKKAVHSREVGRALRQARSFRETPFIFLDGTDEELAKVKARVPAPLFATSAGLAKVLARHAP